MTTSKPAAMPEALGKEVKNVADGPVEEEEEEEEVRPQRERRDAVLTS